MKGLLPHPHELSKAAVTSLPCNWTNILPAVLNHCLPDIVNSDSPPCGCHPNTSTARMKCHLDFKIQSANPFPYWQITWLPKPFGSWKVWMHAPEEASQTFTVRSSLDETMSLPSGDHLAHLTQLVCSVREEMNLVLCTAHTFNFQFSIQNIVLSSHLHRLVV